MNYENTRSLRLKDFARRCEQDPKSVHEWESTRFIAIHPCADETDLLRRINAVPEECRQVDIYWEIQEEVVFVQVQTVAASGRAEGIYARIIEEEVPLLNIVSVLPGSVVTTADVRKAMRAIAASGIVETWGFNKALGPNLKRI